MKSKRITLKDKLLALTMRGVSISDAAEQLGISQDEAANLMTPRLLQRSSKRHRLVKDVIKENFPFVAIHEEHHIGQRLYLDIYLPSIQAAFEIDGIQHSRYNAFFHGDETNFFRQIYNDKVKARLCKEKGIKLLRISHEWTDTEVIQYVIDSIRSVIQNN